MSDLSLPDQIMLSILAATDAVFIPDRDPGARPRHAVICERRWALAKAGIPWSSEKVQRGLDETGRKQVQRALDDLVGRNRVVSFQPHAAKTLGVRLTNTGDSYARALAGLSGVADAVPMIERLMELESGPDACGFSGRVWVSETVLAGIGWGGNEHRHGSVEVEEKLLPALARGWAKSNCSANGHGWYGVWPKGRTDLRKFLPSIELPTATENARSEYYYRVREELEELATAQPRCDREIGEMPMPVCPIRIVDMKRTEKRS
jgi:hypothetical protein